MSPEHHAPHRLPQRLYVWIIAGAALLLLAGGAYLALKPDRVVAALPPEIVRNITSFTPYFYDTVIPRELTLQSDDVQFTGAMLVIPLKDKHGQTVTITEQALPEKLLNSRAQGDDTVEGAPGSAVVAYKEGRTVGTLLTEDKKTLVTVNTTDNLDSSVVKDLIRGLRPVR